MNDIELMDRAVKAEAVLSSAVYQDSYENVRNAIIALIERTPLSDSQTAEDLRRCLKLLRDVRANLELAMKQGKLASFKLEEEKRRKVNPLKGLFR